MPIEQRKWISYCHISTMSESHKNSVELKKTVEKQYTVQEIMYVTFKKKQS